MSLEGIDTKPILGAITAEQLLKDITEIVIDQQSESLRILNDIEKQLEKQGIYIINEKEINKEQEVLLKTFLSKSKSGFSNDYVK